MLSGKVVIVTGSTTGIGEAIARRCVKEGARVLLHGLERADGERVLADLGADKAALHVDDLMDIGAPKRIVEAAISAFGKIDAIVNNAALVAAGDIESTDEAYFDRMMTINCRAPLFIIKHALPHLKKSKGSVLNIGSVNAYSGEEILLPYSISKGAIQTMTRNLGDCLHRQGVRVNQINPGWVLTDNEKKRKHEHGMDVDWYTKLPKMFAPAGRIILPEEIAAAVVLFISDQIGPVSGTVLELEQFPFIGRNPPKES